MERVRNICAAILVAGGVNWGVKGLCAFDVLAWLCGGGGTAAARIVYAAIGIAAVGYVILSALERQRAREREKPPAAQNG